MRQYTFFQEDSNNQKDAVFDSIAATGLGTAAATGLQYASVSPVTSKINRDGFGDVFSNKNKLPSQLKNLKVGNQNISDYLKSKNLTVDHYGSPMGPHFNPHTKNIRLALKDKHMDKWGKSIFAHELGHAVGPLTKNKSNVAIYGGSKLISSTALLAQIINCCNADDESRQNVGKAINVAGGVASLPMVAEEIGASIRGSKLLDLKGKDKAKAFIGVSSYITLALSPTILYYVSEKTRKILKAIRQSRKENPQVDQNIQNLKQQEIKIKV